MWWCGGSRHERDENEGFTLSDKGFMAVILDVLKDAPGNGYDVVKALEERLGDVHNSGSPDALMVFDSFVEPETRHYLSDWQAFGRRWRDLGGEVWADTRSGLTHMGELALSGRSER